MWTVALNNQLITPFKNIRLIKIVYAKTNLPDAKYIKQNNKIWNISIISDLRVHIFDWLPISSWNSSSIWVEWKPDKIFLLWELILIKNTLNHASHLSTKKQTKSNWKHTNPIPVQSACHQKENNWQLLLVKKACSRNKHGYWGSF